MIETPGGVIDTQPPTIPGQRVDLLVDLLAHVRLSGALFLKGQYTGPWAIDSPGNCQLAALLCPDAERVLVFHTIREGRAWVNSKGYRVELEAGDLVVLPHADRHTMGGSEGVQPIPLNELLPQLPWATSPP